MKRKGNFNLKLMGALMAVGIIFTPTSWAGGFSDTSQSEYANAIENLYNKGAINGYSDGLFRPDNTLTKEEGASLIYSSFHLMPVYPVDAQAPKDGEELVKKSFYSTESSVAGLDFVMMPAATDVKDGWSKTPVNTVLEARLMEQNGWKFSPKSKMSKKDFAYSVAKTVLGADKEIDFIEEGIKKEILPDDMKYDGSNITRAEAAHILDFALRDMKVISVFSTSDIHGNMLEYTPSGSKAKVGGSAKVAY